MQKNCKRHKIKLGLFVKGTVSGKQESNMRYGERSGGFSTYRSLFLRFYAFALDYSFNL